MWPMGLLLLLGFLRHNKQFISLLGGRHEALSNPVISHTQVGVYCIHEFGPHLFLGLEHPGPNLLEVETSFNRSTPVKVFSAFEGKTLWNVTGQTSE